MLFSSAYLNFPSWTCTKSSLQSFPWLVTRNLSLNTSSIFPLGTEIIQTHLFWPLGVDIRDPTKVWFLFVWGKISPQGAERKSKRGSQVKSLKNVTYSLEKLIKKKKRRESLRFISLQCSPFSLHASASTCTIFFALSFFSWRRLCMCGCLWLYNGITVIFYKSYGINKFTFCTNDKCCSM